MDDTLLDFNLPVEEPKIIKVIGVGGGGGNAVSHMYREGIRDVTFLLCNTDKQALVHSVVPNHLILGESITKGLGAGNNPELAHRAAEESENDIKQLLGDGTQMVFITAGMGGGTGTGAAPVIARIAKEMDILTVGIVTIPFAFEGEPKILQALYGVEEMRKNVDALLVISNERLLDIYADEDLDTAFAKADSTLTTAVRSISEIITVEGVINLDFADVRTTLKDGGVALMSNGFGEGNNRFQTAIDSALESPLLNNNDAFKAKKILFNISYSDEAKMLTKEMTQVKTFMAGFDTAKIKVIWGLSKDQALGQKIKITILASGFGRENIPEMDKLKQAGNARMTEEDIRKAEEEEIAQKKKRKLLADYGYDDATQGGHRQAGVKYAILSPEELDDDAFITLLEENPTYCRDPKIIRAARNKTSQGEQTATANRPPSEDGAASLSEGRPVIYF
ncbi:MAG: cell division protein FtsZ [Tannerellaceae bacterium]|jgi:cell division protein FtsZ|nr:cell division protein FtsZ [Tannerellaceae bacterium]